MQRPSVQVHSITKPDGLVKTIELPAVFLSPIRSDLVNMIYFQMRKNSRQPYAVSPTAGEQTSAKSWGTGRAVSRIPRVSGGGTHRSGQGAFGNMCRGGRMFAPTKIWRKWHRRISRKQRRYAVASAVAASAVAPLVMARGHRISQVPEIPLVISHSDTVNLTKTKDALSLLRLLHVDEELNKVEKSRRIRAGRGKMRNRRYVQSKGPLIVYGDGNPSRAFRNILGVDLVSVYRLNLLQLAPGGHVGRFIIWTEHAFRALDSIFGCPGQPSKFKSGFVLPRSIMTHTDIGRIIQSPEVRIFLRPKGKPTKFIGSKPNPLRNVKAMQKLNPYALHLTQLNKKKRIAASAAKALTASQTVQQRLEHKQKAFDAMSSEQKEKYLANKQYFKALKARHRSITTFK